MSNKGKNIAVVAAAVLFLGGFSLWNLLKPAGEQSVSERRPLAKPPAINQESILTGRFMSDFEMYTLDQFPLRDQFRTLKAVTSFYIFGQKDNNKIYITDGYASKLEYPLNTASIKYAAERFQFVYNRFIAGKDMKVYLSIIPDKNYFMARQNGYPCMDYEALFAQMQAGMGFAEYIDIAPLLALTDYYRTDTHWRQEKILDVAKALAAKMGAPLSAEYTVTDAGVPFYGVYYGQSALPMPAEPLYYLENAALNACKVYDYETSKVIPVYDLERTKGNDPYEIFLSGSKSLLTIENPNASTGKELLIFRDSFGSSIAPLLAEGYAKITLIDIRYLSPNMLDKFIRFTNQDVLFLYSASVLNNSITIK